MNPEDIKALIDQILQTGEILATRSFELAIRQVYVYATLDVVIGVLLILGSIIGFIAAKKNWNTKAVVDLEMPIVLGIFFSSVIGILNLLCSIRYFINPEWYAVKLLLETFIK